MHNRMDTFHWAVVYLAFVQTIKDRVATFHALRCLADLCTKLDDEETALNLYHTALEGATEIDIHRLRAQSMTGIGDIMMRQGNTVQAKEMWEAAHPLFVKSSQMKDAAVINARLAQLAKAHTPLITDGGTVDASQPSELHTDITGQLDKLAILSAAENLPHSLTAITENALADKTPFGT
ncbi:hypothetical protein DFH09DRAFT_1406286 [Mycena vulgaris]|nr:hypothetical protein DFH09DRAFT_1406286 [Mycena vulgaris]